MQRLRIAAVAVCLFASFAWTAEKAVPNREPATKVLVDFSHIDLSAAKRTDVKANLIEAGTRRLRVTSGTHDQWRSIVFAAPDGVWDLSAFAYAMVEVRNVGDGEAGVGLRLDAPSASKSNTWMQETATLQPGEVRTFRVRLQRELPPALADKFIGMRGYPGGFSEKGGIDSSRVKELRVFFTPSKEVHTIEVDNLVAGGGPAIPLPSDPKRYFPMIDRYGQYIHKDWPGKTHDDGDLARQREAEASQLAQRPGPKDWDQYGGWLGGPKLEATGFFRVEKVNGKWWLVDPEGRLFWSHGVDCVRIELAVTPISDRKFWYAELPEPDSPFAKFYGKGRGAAHGYYSDKRYDTYCFNAANLLRKYGQEWPESYAAVVHQRLRSWGLNTIANWSDAKVYLARKTPYVGTIHAKRPELQGSTGYWGKFGDVFDPRFRENLRARMAQEKGVTAGDPWCLGYFVDNELGWGQPLSLALATLASPASQAAKGVFLEDLKNKYGNIARLNAAWGTTHASWDALAESQTPPDAKKAGDDLAAFATKFAEQYFRICREVVKEVAPNQLYLGCRFAGKNDSGVFAAAKFCDVISYNLYRDSIEAFQLPEAIDRPVIVGEFHFGALDRGMFHTGLRPVNSQPDRARAYQDYVRGALRNPLFVGTHWFQYGDQATTGRSDGENYQIGFVDVCDTPYAETVAAVAEVGAEMYGLRFGR